MGKAKGRSYEWPPELLVAWLNAGRPVIQTPQARKGMEEFIERLNAIARKPLK